MKRKKMTLGERAADKVASFGGSWRFIFLFGAFLIGWALFQNVFPLDPYPYIFLNLLLSCLAAIQGPVILMSQNRQAHLDRERDDDDYKKDVHTNILVRDIHRSQKRILELLEKSSEN